MLRCAGAFRTWGGRDPRSGFQAAVPRAALPHSHRSRRFPARRLSGSTGLPSQSQPCPCGPTVSCVSHWVPSCFSSFRNLASACPFQSLCGQCWFMPLSFTIILIDYLGKEGRNRPQLAENFVIVLSVNSFRLSGPQYYFRHSAWRQSRD